MSSTPLFGVLGEYDRSTELFTAYSERLEQYFIANSFGQCPADDTQEAFSELCEMLRTHYKPKRLVVAETYRFNRGIQEENEKKF